MKAQSEAGFTRAVIEYANLRSWRVAHFRPARTKDGGWRTPCQAQAKGWPDLTLVRGVRIVCAELKVGRNKLTSEQSEWLDALRTAGVACYVWTPELWPEIERVLR